MEYESYLQLYGKKLLLNNNNIKNKRKTGIIKDYVNFNIDILKEILDECNLFDINDYQYSIKSKQNKSNFEIKWHVHDACVNKTKNNQYNENNLNFISDKQILYYKNPHEKPKYSLIVYESNYNKDFTGGELVFADEYIIKPKRGLYILFDSREVHKVNKVRSGIRNNILIKFY